jgi:endopolyphosphatase
VTLRLILPFLQQVDFVIWTGDSARHDNDVKIPRTVHEIYENNKNAVEKMLEVFGGPVRSEDKYVSTIIPIIPTIGNNDIFPHNIMFPGPSALTKEYVELWKHFIPEDQYHVFHKGGYFWQQVVPAVGVDVGMGTKGGLAVFSLNTMLAAPRYFNGAVYADLSFKVLF